MRVSLEWLNEYVDIKGMAPAELAERLTMSGIAVEEIEDMAAPYQGMVVARILTLEKHVQADNLLVGHFNAGPHGEKQVITAAKNVKVGDLVPLALAGTVLPNGKVIADMELKGVPSQGMLCSGIELGLEKESDGVWIFGNEQAPGTPVAAALGMNDIVLVLELTANRSDCLGMINVARETAAILDLPFHGPEVTVKEAGQSISGMAEVTIEDADLCGRYMARVVSGIKTGSSPEWMQRRLRAAGIRAINNIVDVTNYVMLEYNQPLHAFDLDRISDGKIVVRRAKSGEKLITLDGTERSFGVEDLLIADPSAGLCVAGVMGGSSSEVTEKTTNLLLEAAYFNPRSIRKTAKNLEMRTESSYRFERGIDSNNIVNALDRAAQLIEAMGAGTVARGVIDQHPRPLAATVIPASYQKINDYLGTGLIVAEIKGYLERVAITVKELGGDRFEATIPSYRQDIKQLADLTEEVARLYGYDRIPATLPGGNAAGERTSFQKLQFDLRRLLQGIGLSEAFIYSLYSRNVPARLGVAADERFTGTVDLMAPLSEEQAVLRTNLAHGMLETLAFNAKRRQTDLALYEMGRVYLPVKGAPLPDEPLRLSVGLMGRRREPGWNQEGTETDFYDIKGILELVAARFRVNSLTLTPSKLPFLHPGQSAEIVIDGIGAGFIGQVHPGTMVEYDLAQPAFLLELDLTLLEEHRHPEVAFRQLPRFPAIDRDLALVLPENVAVADIIKRIQQLGGELLENVALFDVYQGDQVAAGQRSLAFSLIYRSPERTLNDGEVAQIQEELLCKLKAEYGAAIRE
jgi:phenylalanyl-tRNA synthetase beta chain